MQLELPKLAIGKRVGDDLYLHISALNSSVPEALRHIIQASVQRLPPNAAPNVFKLNARTGQMSCLLYLDFDTDPFPRLAGSWSMTVGSEALPSFRNYVDTLNPPILHRKELLVEKKHPGRAQWQALTEVAESLGLFDNTRSIGFKLNWLRTVADKGYRLDGSTFLPIGNTESDAEVEGNHMLADSSVQRHLTALARTNLSAPVQLLIRHSLLTQQRTFFDYGCGRGDDVLSLRTNQYEAFGWDPHFATDGRRGPADVVNLGFVLNVIEDPAERADALHYAFGFTDGVLAVSVMLEASEKTGRTFRDGVLTKRGTFQKYFTQGELKSYIENALNQEAFMVGPGVAFVFADKLLEQSFVAKRLRRIHVVDRLLTLPSRIRRQPRELIAGIPRTVRPSLATRQIAESKHLLDKLWALSLELGRFPHVDEIAFLAQLELELGTLNRAIRLIKICFDPSLLASAASIRADDLRLYFAMQLFSKRKRYRQLPPRLQHDVKAYFGDYASAQSAAMQLMKDASDPDTLALACETASTNGLGFLTPGHSLQLHISLVDRLPVVLRAYVACGLLLWDSVDDVQLIKIHIGSGKVTLLAFDNFDEAPLPTLRRRVKVNIRMLDYTIFEYGSAAYPKPLLFNKSQYIHEDYPGYAEQLAFDEQLNAERLLVDDLPTPSATEFNSRLLTRRFEICDHRLERSKTIPPIGAPCCQHFTFRDFIECGDTQKALQITNFPERVETFNAIQDLAEKIIDPLVEYFGKIKLTYGFCSHALSMHIPKGIAPRIDQHASCELRKNGVLICSRAGAACDFIVEDEHMYEVARWILSNLPFDRMYYYGDGRPIHVSYGPSPLRAAYSFEQTKNGRLTPRQVDLQSFAPGNF